MNRARLGHLAGLGGGALVLGMTLVLVRGEPNATSDQGVFLSIAARMLDGDRLYADVVDNKDPFFFYTYAGALWAGGWRAPAALDGLWFALAAVSIVVLLRELDAPRPAVVASFFVYPLSLTGWWYEPGLSMLAGLAIAPLVGWLWLRERFVASGVVLGTAILFKLSIALVIGAPLVAFLLLGAPAGSRLRHTTKAAVGFLTLVGLTGVFLAARGELRAYLDVLHFNVRYPDGALRTMGSDGLGAHLDVVREFFLAAGKWQAPAAVLAVGAFVVAFFVGRTKGGRAFQLLAVVTAATLVAALGTLGLTAIWVHHLQMLSYPAALIAAAVVAALSVSYGQRAGFVAAAVCVGFALWSSVKHEPDFGVPPAWSASPVSVPADLLEAARNRFYGGASSVTYMVLGGNSENAHAVFIDDAFELSCRWFHLYPTNVEEQFSETLDCANEERPMLVLVTLGFFDDRPATPDWRAFVAEARRLLDSRYELVSEAYPGFQVWRLS